MLHELVEKELGLVCNYNAEGTSSIVKCKIKFNDTFLLKNNEIKNGNCL